MTKARDLANAADVLDDVSATELSYVNGVTSAIQTQLNNKQAVVANVNDTEIGYLDGVTSAIQTQIDGKSSTSHNHNSTYVANSLVDAKGDLLVGSANDTVSRLAVASTAGYLLTVDSAEATGLKWTAPAASGGMTQLSSTSVSGSQTITLSNILSGSYKEIVIVGNNLKSTPNDAYYSFRFETSSGTGIDHRWKGIKAEGSGAPTLYGFSNNGDSYVQISTVGQNDDYAANFQLRLHAVDINQQYVSATFDGATQNRYMFLNVFISQATLHTVKIRNDQGNFSGGTIRVYGIS
jgi:hypothetical protein